MLSMNDSSLFYRDSLSQKSPPRFYLEIQFHRNLPQVREVKVESCSDLFISLDLRGVNPTEIPFRWIFDGWCLNGTQPNPNISLPGAYISFQCALIGIQMFGIPCKAKIPFMCPPFMSVSLLCPHILLNFPNFHIPMQAWYILIHIIWEQEPTTLRFKNIGNLRLESVQFESHYSGQQRLALHMEHVTRFKMDESGWQI